MFSAAGFLGKPGIRRISPVIGIKNPAPLEISILFTVTIKSSGLHKSLGSSERDF